jgi:hypothetical protein
MFMCKMVKCDSVKGHTKLFKEFTFYIWNILIKAEKILCSYVFCWQTVKRISCCFNSVIKIWMDYSVSLTGLKSESLTFRYLNFFLFLLNFPLFRAEIDDVDFWNVSLILFFKDFFGGSLGKPALYFFKVCLKTHLMIQFNLKFLIWSA